MSVVCPRVQKLGLTRLVGSFTLGGVDEDMRLRLEQDAIGMGIERRWEGDVLKWHVESAVSALNIMYVDSWLTRPRFKGHYEAPWLTTQGLVMLASFGTTGAAENIALMASKILALYIEAAARKTVGAARPADGALMVAVERMAGVLGRDHPDVQKYAARVMAIEAADVPAGDPLGRYLTVQMYLTGRNFPLSWVVQQRSAFGMAIAARWRRANPGRDLLKHVEPVWQFGSWGGATVIEPGTNRYTEADRPLFDEVLEDWRRLGKLPPAGNAITLGGSA